MQQHTLRTSFQLAGIGVHSGVACKVVVRPAPANTGIVFVRNGQTIPLSATAVTDTTLCTKVQNATGATAQTVEHLLAALHALQVDNALVEMTADEVPILDGSSQPWVEHILSVGLHPQTAPRRSLAIQAPQTFTLAHGSQAHVAPYAGLKITLTAHFPLLGEMHGTWEITPECFAKDLAPARTFCLLRDVERLQAAGLIAGGTLECAVVFDDHGQPLNPEGLRYPDEPLRHKVLDVVGDLYMAGQAVHGHFTLTNTGHGLNNQLLRQLVEQNM